MIKFHYTVIQTSNARAFESDLNQCGDKELVATHISTSNQDGAAITNYIAVLRESLDTLGRSHQ